ASARTRRACTESTSASSGRRWFRLHRCWRFSFETGAGWHEEELQEGGQEGREAGEEGQEACGDERRAPRHLGDPPLLPYERDPDLVRVRDGVQPARHRPLGAALRVRQLLRLVRRPPPERLRAAPRGAAGVRLDRGDLQL